MEACQLMPYTARGIKETHKGDAPSFLGTLVIEEGYTRCQKVNEVNKGDKGDKQVSVASGTAPVRLPSIFTIAVAKGGCGSFEALNHDGRTRLKAPRCIALDVRQL